RAGTNWRIAQAAEPVRVDLELRRGGHLRVGSRGQGNFCESRRFQNHRVGHRRTDRKNGGGNIREKWYRGRSIEKLDLWRKNLPSQRRDVSAHGIRENVDSREWARTGRGAGV